MSTDLQTFLSEKITERQAAVQRAEELLKRLVRETEGVATNPRPLLDFVMLTAMYRSRRLLDAARVLCDDRNTIALLSLVRLHVDTLMRVNAVAHEKDPGAVEFALCTGENVRSLKTRDGVMMRDDKLIGHLNDDLPWMREIYEKYCGEVHFSFNHVQQCLREEFLAPSEIKTDGKTQEEVIDERLCEAVSDLLKVTEPLVGLAEGYHRERRAQISHDSEVYAEISAILDDCKS